MLLGTMPSQSHILNTNFAFLMKGHNSPASQLQKLKCITNYLSLLIENQ